VTPVSRRLEPAIGAVSGHSWEVCRADSAIHGVGVFTRESIPSGVFVLECRGIILCADEVVGGARVMQIGPDRYLAEDPAHPSIDDFLNHSCEPNVGFRTGTLELFSLRAIEQDQELVFDYSTCMNEPGWAMSCRCGASSCRGQVRSYCDLAGVEQRRLEHISLAYLRCG
jgi:uncharacterized protein